MTGKTAYHCHILPHEDTGMMGTPLITPPPRAHVEFLGSHTLPNDGRISGTSTLYVFDYRVTGLGAARHAT